MYHPPGSPEAIRQDKARSEGMITTTGLAASPPTGDWNWAGGTPDWRNVGRQPAPAKFTPRTAEMPTPSTAAGRGTQRPTDPSAARPIQAPSQGTPYGGSLDFSAYQTPGVYGFDGRLIPGDLATAINRRNQQMSALTQQFKTSDLAYNLASQAGMNMGPPQFDFPAMIANANQMVDNGFYNPFMRYFEQQDAQQQFMPPQFGAPRNAIEDLLSRNNIQAPPGFMDQLLSLLGQQAAPPPPPGGPGMMAPPQLQAAPPGAVPSPPQMLPPSGAAQPIQPPSQGTPYNPAATEAEKNYRAKIQSYSTPVPGSPDVFVGSARVYARPGQTVADMLADIKLSGEQLTRSFDPPRATPEQLAKTDAILQKNALSRELAEKQRREQTARARSDRLANEAQLEKLRHDEAMKILRNNRPFGSSMPGSFY